MVPRDVLFVVLAKLGVPPWGHKAIGRSKHLGHDSRVAVLPLFARKCLSEAPMGPARWGGGIVVTVVKRVDGPLSRLARRDENEPMLPRCFCIECGPRRTRRDAQEFGVPELNGVKGSLLRANGWEVGADCRAVLARRPRDRARRGARLREGSRHARA